MTVRIIVADVRAALAELEDESVHCVVSSPPYWGLRDYGIAGQLGLEPTLGEHLDNLVAIFREVRRVLRKDGTLWLNYGDCFATTVNGRSAADTKALGNDDRTFRDKPFSTVGPIYDPSGGGYRGNNRHNSKAGPSGRICAGGTLKPKDLCLVANRLALALQQPFYLGKVPHEIDRAWLAAIIDGEGSIFIHRQPEGSRTGGAYVRKADGFCVGIAISNCSEALVARAANLLGRANIQHIEAKGGNRRDHYHWRLTGNLAKNLLREVYPYLVAKQREARVAIACPPSGELAAASWSALKDLHKGRPTDFDAPEPNLDDLWGQGWWVRQEVIWSKKNPMPESTRDRPTTSHEKVWLLTKSERYFYDAEAVAEPAGDDVGPGISGWAAGDGKHLAHEHAVEGRETHGKRNPRGKEKNGKANPPGSRLHKGLSAFEAEHDRKYPTRNRRSVWTIPLSPFPEAHFATFPPDLVEPCIKAGTSEAGCCSKCGAPLVREVSRSEIDENRRKARQTKLVPSVTKAGVSTHGLSSTTFGQYLKPRDTLGWKPSCKCDAPAVPCTVLDPFGGAGTTGLVADRLGRHAVLIELNPAYAEIAERRIKGDAPLFAEVST